LTHYGTKEEHMAKAELPLDQIIHGDCIEELNSLPKKSVDVIFADPPYNLQLSQELWRPNMTKVRGVTDPWDKFGSFGDYDVFTRNWLSACRRVLKDDGTIWVIGAYHNIFRLGTILQDLGYWILNDVVWIKTNPMPNFRGTRFTNAHETLVWAQKIKGRGYTFNHHTMKALNDDLQMRSDWQLPICAPRERVKIKGQKVHSTQKPETLLYLVLEASTKPGDVVLDPFFGTGTTGAVAKKLHRRWIGIEQNKDYVRAARKRIDNLAPPLMENLLYSTRPRNQGFKIPFGKLLIMGLLKPGDKLYLARRGTAATILADGHIASGEHRGSIHAVGSVLLGARCNGWTNWEFLDAETGERKAIDELRKKAEKLIGAPAG
jgi:DNA modification methylase